MLVLLDRDGVLNRDRPDYVKTPDELVMIEGSAAAVARLNRAGHRVAAVTNQSAVGRGLIDAAMLGRIHDRLRSHLAAAGAHLDALIECTDPPWAPSERRKPEPGMLREALARFGAAAAETPMIGDSLRDLEAAAAAGCRRYLVRTGNVRKTEGRVPRDLEPVRVFDDLGDTVDHLLSPDTWRS